MKKRRTADGRLSAGCIGDRKNNLIVWDTKSFKVKTFYNIFLKNIKNHKVQCQFLIMFCNDFEGA